jgi:D-alanine-D-alanine ligase
MARRLRVGVVFGGRSGEHEISLRSARAVLAALSPKRYDAVPIAITKQGRWFSGRDSRERLERAQQRLRPITAHGTEVSILPEPMRRGYVSLTVDRLRAQRLDVVFPVLHGTYGEDGTLQGLLELAGLPYVGAGVLASAVAMDKDVSKRLLRDAGLPLTRFVALRGRAVTDAVGLADRLAEEGIGYPCFVKPANLGSSIGITRVEGAAQLAPALRLAARYDTTVLVEAGVVGRELEVGVVGNSDDPSSLRVSVPGEIIPGRTFYDYVDKYVEDGARTVVPAHLRTGLKEELSALALQAYTAVGCDGMARVDFFLRQDDDRLLVNEVNTIPGFTPVSLFPRMWEATGMSFPALVDRLVALALARHARRARLLTSFAPRAAGGGRRSPAPRRPARGH